MCFSFLGEIGAATCKKFLLLTFHVLVEFIQAAKNSWSRAM